MTTQSKQLTPIGQICQTLDKMEGDFSQTLNGTGVNPKRFLATAKTAIQTHADKDRLANADRQSLYLAIKKSASDGLMPDNREAALVVYGSQVQYQPMVQGLVKLARNSGEIESINSEVVYSNDEFNLFYDFEGVQFTHKPLWTGDRGEPVLVWASVKLKSGERMARAYDKKRIMSIATRSKQSGNYDPAKGKDWEEFWRKAAIRNILKYAPKSTALDQAMEAMDAEFEYETQQDVPAAPVKRQSKTAQAVKESELPPEPTPEVIDVEVVEPVNNDGPPI